MPSGSPGAARSLTTPQRKQHHTPPIHPAGRTGRGAAPLAARLAAAGSGGTSPLQPRTRGGAASEAMPKIPVDQGVLVPTNHLSRPYLTVTQPTSNGVDRVRLDRRCGLRLDLRVDLQLHPESRTDPLDPLSAQVSRSVTGGRLSSDRPSTVWVSPGVVRMWMR